VSRIKLKKFHSFDNNVSEAWIKLEKNASCFVFQRLDWLRHWQSTAGEADRYEPLIIVVFEDNEPIALFPLSLHRVFGVRVIKFLGGEQADYNAPIVRLEKFSVDEFMSIWTDILALLPAHDVRLFVRVPEKLDFAKNPFMSITAHWLVEDTACYKILPDSWSEFQQHVSKKLLKDNDRMMRRLSEKGNVKIIEVTSEVQYRNILKTTISQKTQRYSQTGVRNIFSNAAVKRFYQGLYAAVDGGAKVHLSALIVDDCILATHLGIYDHKRYYYLLPSFDTGCFSKYSPGRLLLEYLIKLMIEKNLNVFDFTVGGESYKKKWCDSEIRLYRLAQAYTVRGLLYLRLQGLVFWVKHNQYSRSILTNSLRLFRKLGVKHGK
jgi:CelD/BcsL family acetyltransferase involved in cellulose biosynthesis